MLIGCRHGFEHDYRHGWISTDLRPYLRAMEYCESGGMNNYSKGLIIIERDQLQLGLDAALGRGDDLMLELDDARNEIARLKLERAALFTALREADGR